MSMGEADVIEGLKAALAQQQGGDHAAAASLLGALLEREPSNVDALHLMGLSLHALGRRAEGLASIERAIALRPDEPIFLTNAGVIAMALGRAESAAHYYRRALALDPRYADAHNNLAILLESLGRFEEAAAHLEKAIALRPDSPSAYGNRGNLLRRQGRLVEAEESYRRAISLDARRAELHNNLGNVLKQQNRYDEALDCFDRATVLRPNYAEAHANRGFALAARGTTEEAASALDAAIALRPDPRFRIARAALLPVIPQSTAEIAIWRERFAGGLDTLLAEGLRLEASPLEAPAMNFFLAYHGEDDRPLMTKLARLYAAACPSLLWEAPHCRARRPVGRRRRVGVLSRYLRDHAVAWTVEGLLQQLPRDRIELVILTPDLADDSVSPDIRAAAESVVPLPYDLETARRKIAACELDLLLYTDIGMNAFSYFLAFARLAPVQCVTWGHPDTTGIPALDYFISSDLAEPEDAESHYSERLVRLDGVQTCYRRPPMPDPFEPRVAFGLPEDATLYLCPQSLFKIHPEMDAAFAAILHRDPRARLVVFRSTDDHAAERLLERWRNALGAGMDRVIVLPRMRLGGFLNVLALADVVLDTWPFGGGNTSYQSFAMGVPVVTLPGQFMRGRTSLVHYRCMDIVDCIADSADSYVDIALRLGTDPVWRGGIVDRIRARSHVLFDDRRAAEAFAQFLLEAA